MNQLIITCFSYILSIYHNDKIFELDYARSMDSRDHKSSIMTFITDHMVSNILSQIIKGSNGIKDTGESGELTNVIWRDHRSCSGIHPWAWLFWTLVPRYVCTYIQKRKHSHRNRKNYGHSRISRSVSKSILIIPYWSTIIKLSTMFM